MKVRLLVCVWKEEICVLAKTLLIEDLSIDDINGFTNFLFSDIYAISSVLWKTVNFEIFTFFSFKFIMTVGPNTSVLGILFLSFWSHSNYNILKVTYPYE